MKVFLDRDYDSIVNLINDMQLWLREFISNHPERTTHYNKEIGEFIVSQIPYHQHMLDKIDTVKVVELLNRYENITIKIER